MRFSHQFRSMFSEIARAQGKNGVPMRQYGEAKYLSWDTGPLKQSSTHFPRNNHGASHCNCHDDRASLCKLWEQQSSHCFFLVIGSAIRWRTCYQKMMAFLRPRQEDHLASDTKELCWSSVEVSFRLGFSSLHLLRTSAASRFDPSGLPFYFLGYPRRPARYSDNN